MSRDPLAELWLADIQEGVRLANQDTQKALKSERTTTHTLFEAVCCCSLTVFVCVFSVSGTGGSESGC